MKHIAIFILLIFVAFRAKGQVVVSPIPHLEGYFTLDDIWRVNLIYAQPQAISAQLEVIVEDAQHGLILTSTSPFFTLSQGSNRPAFNAAGVKMQYGKGNKTQVLRRTGRFPYGNYIICYRVLSANSSTVLAEFCQEELIRPFSPPELINPYNGESINTTLPILSWKPPFPPGTTPIEYGLRLVEIKERQQIIEALEKNAPILNRLAINGTSLPYPGDAPKLEVGKSYAWQVSAKAGDFDLGVTEIWEFEVAKAESEEISLVEYRSFREVKLMPDGRFNPVDQKLKFSFNNRWGATRLDYETTSPPTTNLDRIYYKIYPVGKQGSPITPTISTTIISGVNNITINLSGVSGMNNGENYIMVLREPSGRFYYLEFTYNS